MSAFKILIADDESQARKLICLYLDQSPIPKITIESSDGREVLSLIETEHPDILFLDIKMPGLTGIEVLQLREKKLLPAILFTTAMAEYALSAFDLDAIDYLLKPFDQERFLKALRKATDYVEYIRSNSDKEKLRSLSVKNGTKTIIIGFSEIEYFLADGPYIRVIAGRKQYLLSMPMYELQHSLPPSFFLRVHRSCIVNTGFVKEIRSLLNGDFTLLLQSGKELRASRTYREQLRASFGKI
jgi:two-component system, LytTR family, response regulator